MDGTPVGLVMEGLAPVSRPDGLASAAASIATRAAWTRVPHWSANRAGAAEDATAMDRAVEAALAPVPGVVGWQAAAAAVPPSVSFAAIAGPPLSDMEDHSHPPDACGAGYTGSYSFDGSHSSRSTSLAPHPAAQLLSTPSPPFTSSLSWSALSSSSFEPSPSASPLRRQRGRPRKHAAIQPHKMTPVGKPVVAESSRGEEDDPSSSARPRRTPRLRNEHDCGFPHAPDASGGRVDQQSSAPPRRRPGSPRKQPAGVSRASAGGSPAGTDQLSPSPSKRGGRGRTRKPPVTTATTRRASAATSTRNRKKAVGLNGSPADEEMQRPSKRRRTVDGGGELSW